MDLHQSFGDIERAYIIDKLRFWGEKKRSLRFLFTSMLTQERSPTCICRNEKRKLVYSQHDDSITVSIVMYIRLYNRLCIKVSVYHYVLMKAKLARKCTFLHGFYEDLLELVIVFWKGVYKITFWLSSTLKAAPAFRFLAKHFCIHKCTCSFSEILC